MPSHLYLFKTDTDGLEASTVLEIFYRPGMPLIKLHHTATSNIKRKFSLAMAFVTIELATMTLETLSQVASRIVISGFHIPCIHMLSIACVAVNLQNADLYEVRIWICRSVLAWCETNHQGYAVVSRVVTAGTSRLGELNDLNGQRR